MNFETATDQELEQALACLVYKCEGWELSKTGGSFHSCGIDGSASYVQPIPKYCTDISATWPLMIEHGIELSPCFNGWWFAGVVDSYTHDEEVLSYSGITTCENPLRAVVACLIKVLESKHDRT
ncbi:hypothetical protein [Vibrio cholerae]|uniref:hypothetical protein n=1 Tax=Vibrio cholerae TaxID=666 RepID=UPI0005B626F8|nr:hypothetical protein [Vibrio cholerae]